MKKLVITEVWAQLFLSEADTGRIHDFFLTTVGVNRKYLVRAMHITIYYARRPMPGLSPISEQASVVISARDLRFMVMAPGGENPRAELEPASRKIGVRVHRQSIATSQIQTYRQQLLGYETLSVHGKRKPSTNRTNAFGARHFQPHMSVLRAGSGIPRNLKIIGDQFRELIGNLTFDRFEVEIVKKVIEKPHTIAAAPFALDIPSPSQPFR